jgi:diguanylate cyclase (GGDEF)-like protein/PAS domain S-box-containing protein
MKAPPSATSRWRELLGLAITAVSALLLFLFGWQAVHVSGEGQGDRLALQRERGAVRATRAIVDVMAAEVEYRRLRSERAPAPSMSAARDGVDRAFERAASVIQTDAPGLEIGKPWTDAKAAWASSRSRGFAAGYLGAPVLSRLQQSIDSLQDASGLTYDSNTATQNLSDSTLASVPRALSQISRAHDIARNAMRTGAMPLRHRLELATILTAMRATLDLSGDHIDDILSSMAQELPARAPAFASARSAVAAYASSGTAFNALVTQRFLTEARPTVSPGALDASAQRAAAAARAAFDRLADALDTELAQGQHFNDLRNTYLYLALLCGAVLIVGVMLLLATLFARRDRRLLDEAQQESSRLQSELARQHAESALRLSEAQFRAVFDGAAMGIAILDAKRAVVESNEVFRVLFGENAERIFEGHQPELDELMNGERDAFEYEYHSLGPSGRELWAHTTISRVGDERGGTPFVMCIVRDVTALKRSERRAQYDKTHDRMTGLPNRAVLEDRLRERFGDAGVLDSFFAVLFVDLDRFKDVNESLGHAAGDFVLTTIAGRLRASIDADDVVARLGSDEFAVLVGSLGDILHVEQIARRIVANLARPIDLSGRSIYVGASVGVAIASAAYEKAEDVMRDADIAMRQAKSAGGGRYAVFDSTMHAQAERRLELTSDLRSALERNEFRLLYQPIVDLSTGELVACEALIRWDHPKNGLMSPNEFMPLAEQTAFAGRIGNWVVRTACEQMARWGKTNGSFLMHVNISAAELVDSEFAQRLVASVENNGLDPSVIVLEITENVVLDVETRANASLDDVRARGFKICIDDFGTGYSSLRYLQQFKVDSIKIDRMFVAGTNGELASEPIVRTLLTLAESYDVRVVAEGVETEVQRESLRTSGCRLAQGYLFARPMPPAEMAVRYPSVLGAAARTA